MLVAAPEYFIVKNTSILGPVSENPAENKIFRIDYEVGQNAPDGAFSVGLKYKATTPNTLPDPDVELASVDFIGNFHFFPVV